MPLCVDLDGTLVKSDTLLDTVIVLARQNPAAVLQFPQWVAQGKAASDPTLMAIGRKHGASAAPARRRWR